MKAYLEMEMPESCVDYPISGYSGLFERNCQLVNDEVSIAVWDEKVGANFPEGYIYERHPNCPLKPMISSDVDDERNKEVIKSLEWIKFNIPDEGKNTFGHAVHFYINNAIEIIKGICDDEN